MIFLRFVKKHIINKVISMMLGKKRWQSFFEEMYFTALRGMNIGLGDDYATSGEKYVLEYIKEKYKTMENIVIFDVGANLGFYSNMIYEVFHNKAKIFAFEPSKKTFNKMLDNTKNIENISRYNFGFGDTVAKIKLYTDTEGSGMASVYKRNLEWLNIYMDKEEEVEISTIDEFCHGEIHFLKLDVEGHELKVLEGAKKKIESNAINYIQFEFGGCNIDSRTYFRNFWYLLKDKYTFYRVLRDGLFEISEYREQYECFTTTNFLLERKTV